MKFHLKGDLEARVALQLFLHIFIEFIENEPSTKFMGFWSFLRSYKVRSLEGLDVSDVIPANVHNMHFSADVHNMHFSTVHDVLEQELVWFGRFEQNLLFFLAPFLLLCHLR